MVLWLRMWSDMLSIVTAVMGTSPGWLSLAEWQFYARAAVANFRRRTAYFRSDRRRLIDVIRICLSI